MVKILQKEDSFFVDPFEAEAETAARAKSSGKDNPAAKKGHLSSRFQIQTTSPIDYLSSKFAKAYSVNATGVSEEVYALVFDNRFPVNSRVLHSMKKVDNHVLPKFYDAGKVKLGKNEQFAIVLSRPQGKSIGELVKKNQLHMSEKKLRDQIIKPINDGLFELHESGCSLGNINPDNVFFDTNNGSVYLKEAISEFNGYSQPQNYESLRVAVCLPQAKGCRDPQNDYFSLGVLAAYILLNGRLFETIKPEEILERRFTDGTLSVYANDILQGAGFAQHTHQLMRGLLNDNDKDRWGADAVDDWCAKKDKGAVPPSRIHRETTTSFIFDGKEYLGRKHLVHDIQQKWDVAKTAIKIDDLVRWVKLALKLPKVSDQLESLINPRQDIILSDEKLSRILHILDSTGPLRFKDYNINIWGMGPYIANAFIEGKKEHLQAMASMFSYGLVEQWIGIQERPDDYSFSNLLWTPFKVAQNMTRASLGFGMERCLYMLNPDMGCQSKILSGHFVADIADLLLSLEEVAEANKDKTDPLDRQSAAFIGQHVDLSDEVRVRSIQRHASLARNTQITMLALLAVAQGNTRITNMKHLTNWIKTRLMPITEEFHNTRIKKDFTSSMEKAAKTGSLNDLFKVVTNPSFISRDISGFIEAKRQYRALNQQIASLGKQSNIEKVAYQYGLRISVMFSYFVVMLTLLMIVIRSA